MSLEVTSRVPADPGRSRHLSERIEQTVRLRTASRIRNLSVEISGSAVILTGVAPTYYVKQLATHAALDEIEHRTLTNDIEVA